MIRPLPAFLTQYPLLGRVPVRCETCGEDHPIESIPTKRSCHAQPGGWKGPRCDATLPDISTILATDDPAEVAVLCASVSWCPDCGTPGTEGKDQTACDSDRPTIPVSARWFLWTGEPVDDWRLMLAPPGWSTPYGDTAARYILRNGKVEAEGRPPSPLSAAVLVAGPSEVQRRDSVSLHGYLQRIAAARAACTEAGVEFLTPGGAS